MKIFMFSNLFPPALTGSSLYTYRLVKAIAKKVDTIHLFAPDHGPVPDDLIGIKNLKIHHLKAWRLPKLNIALNFEYLNITLLPANFRKIKAVLDEEGCDVIHQQNHVFDTSILSHWLSRKFNIPRVITIHTTVTHSIHLYNRLLKFGERLLLKRFIERSADRVISPDNTIADYIRDRQLSEGSSWIPYGINPIDLEQVDPSPLVDQYQLANKQVILSVGHIHINRNRLSLIRAFSNLERKTDNLMLVIIGNIGDDRPVKLVQQLGLKKKVLFLGYQPQIIIHQWLRICKLEAHWVEKYQTPGIATLEAMAAGKAVVTACEPNCYPAGIIRPGENMLTVESESVSDIETKIEQLLSDTAYRDRLAQAAKKTLIDNFTWEKIAANMVDRYHALSPTRPREQAVSLPET